MANVTITRDTFKDAALVETPAMATTLPATNAQLTARDAVARSTSIATQVIQGHWGGNMRKLDAFYVFRHRGYGGKIRLQLWGNADYTSSVYDSGTVDFVSALPTLENFDWNGGLGFGLVIDDQLVTEAPYFLSFASVNAGSFTITFSQCQNLYWEFGRIILGPSRALPDNPDQKAVQVGWADNRVISRTRGASARLRPGERWREVTANMFFLTDANRAIWRDYMALMGNEDVALSMRPGAGGREERDHVFNVYLKQHAPFAWGDGNFHDSQLFFTEA